MLELVGTLMRGYLWYLTYLHPVVRGAQLCRSASPSPAQVTNATLALLLGWAMELLDTLLLAPLLTLRWPCTLVRIVLCLYCSHPGFLGALRVYERALAPLVDAYGPVMDELVLRHLDELRQSGVVHYTVVVALSLVRGSAGVVAMARRLLDAGAATAMPAASLPRRFSQARDNNDSDSSASPVLPVALERFVGVVEAAMASSPAPPSGSPAPLIRGRSMAIAAAVAAAETETAVRKGATTTTAAASPPPPLAQGRVTGLRQRTPPPLPSLQAPAFSENSGSHDDDDEATIDFFAGGDDVALDSEEDGDTTPPARVRQDRAPPAAASGLRRLPDLSSR